MEDKKPFLSNYKSGANEHQNKYIGDWHTIFDGNGTPKVLSDIVNLTYFQLDKITKEEEKIKIK